MSVHNGKQNRFSPGKPTGLYLMELRSRLAERNGRSHKLVASVPVCEPALPVGAAGKSRRIRKS